MRILLFLGINIAVLVLVSIIFNLLGLEGTLARNGVDLNLGSLLVFCSLFGFSGSMISLFLSKFMAKRGTGTKIIETPKNQEERWLVDTMQSLASMVVMWFSRYREYRADAAGAQLAGTRSMIGALQKLKEEQGLPQDLPGEMTAFGIRSKGGSGLAALLRSHPPLDDRILALQTR